MHELLMVFTSTVSYLFIGFLVAVLAIRLGVRNFLMWDLEDPLESVGSIMIWPIVLIYLFLLKPYEIWKQVHLAVLRHSASAYTKGTALWTKQQWDTIPAWSGDQWLDPDLDHVPRNGHLRVSWRQRLTVIEEVLSPKGVEPRVIVLLPTGEIGTVLRRYDERVE